jgi:hypothetical protein
MIRVFSAGACRTRSKRCRSFLRGSIGAGIVALLCLCNHDCAAAEPALLTVTGFGSPNGPVATIRPIGRLRNRADDMSESVSFPAVFGVPENVWGASLVDPLACVTTDLGHYKTDTPAADGDLGFFPIYVEISGPICGGNWTTVNVAWYIWNGNVPTASAPTNGIVQTGGAPTDSFKVTWTPYSPGYIGSATEDISATADLQVIPGTNKPPPPPPTITGPGTMWWLNCQGQNRCLQPNDANYPSQITLTATPAGAAQYNWTITNGTNQAALFDANQSTTYSASTNTVAIDSVIGSAAMSDVVVTVSDTDASGQQSAMSNSFKITVKQPYRDVALTENNGCETSRQQRPGPYYANTTGYACAIHYRILDQFNDVLPSDILLNEHFVTAPYTEWSAGQNWLTVLGEGECGTDHTECGAAHPNDWYDLIGIVSNGECDATSQIPTTTCSPVPKDPGTAAGSVVSWDGIWSVGSRVPGKGVTIQFNEWHRYIDHATHESVISPLDQP